LRAPEKGEVDAEAGNERLDAILGILGEPVEGADATKLGLNPAHTQITFKVTEQDGKAREETVSIGRPASDGSAHARREQDGTLLLLTRGALRALTPDATLVRSRKILEFEERHLLALRVESPQRQQSLERKPGGSYALTSPKGFEADANLVSDLVDALSTLTTERWVADTK
jgi:hypothetical protein